ncbi:MAG: hypothetical protein EP297_00940 [Gammaproteobacteria bacterium]|nr:MAG: hypothetical protein EP297_00940 [Gammaproteobacteria bacterium]
MEPLTEKADDRAIEQRDTDRRKPSINTLMGALFKQRRRLSRRDGDAHNSYVDWYNHWPLVATVLIILMCSIDAFLTLILLSHGAVELNILMDWLIKEDIQTFAIVKMFVTGVALVVLVMHFNFRVYKYVAVRYLIYALVPAYSLLIAHELNMLAQI